MPKVSIIGAGNVGASAAFIILMKKLADVVMVDIVDSVLGKALDMKQAGTVLGFENEIIGTKDFSQIKDSDIVVITAGKPRTPEIKTREDLLEINKKIIDNVLNEVKKHCPSTILVVVTNPLDLIVDYIIKQGFDKKKVIGQSGVLDSARFMTFLGKGSEGMVIGYHSDDMIPLVSGARIDGEEICRIFDKEEIDRIVERTKKGGAEITSLLGTSAYYAPGAAIARMVEVILEETEEVLPCCVYADGEYELGNVCIGLPCKLNKEGMEIVRFELSEEELNSLKTSAEKREKQ